MLQEVHAWRERCLKTEAKQQQEMRPVRPVFQVMAATDVDVLEDQKGRLLISCRLPCCCCIAMACCA